MRHFVYQQFQNKKSITLCIQPSFFLSFFLYYAQRHTHASQCTHMHTSTHRAQMEVAEHWQMHQSRRGIGHRWHVLDKHLYPGEAQRVHVDVHVCVCVCTHVSIKKPLLGRPLQYMRELQMSPTYTHTQYGLWNTRHQQ